MIQQGIAHTVDGAGLIACQPVIPLMKLFGDPHWFGTSIVWLLAAVALKCTAFAAFERRRMPLEQAFGAMLAGNVVSALVGAVVAFANGPLFVIGGFVAVYLFSRFPARRLAARDGRLKGDVLALALGLLVVATWFLFGAAQGVMDAAISYWPLKVASVFTGLLVSFALTALWEEWVIAGIAGKRESYLDTVAKANAITFFAVFVAAAIRVWPERMASPSFLVRLLAA
jgi:hypothetical protein